MAFCRLVFPLLVLSVVTATNVPVFLWGDLAKSSIKSNPLTTVAAQEFKGILKSELVDDPFLVVFIEETLSNEDLSRKNVDGETSFNYLQRNLQDSVYLASVENALSVLNKVNDKAVHVKLTENGLSEDIEDADNRVLFISLRDAKEGESRYDMLRRHNDFMEKEVQALQDGNGKVVAVYTARNPSWTIPESHLRVRRQADNSTTNNEEYNLNGLRLYVKEITVSHSNETVTLSGFVGSQTEFNETIMNTTLNFGQSSLTLSFTKSRGYWFFDTVTLVQTNPAVNEQLYPTSELYALVDFSYRCMQTISFTGINETTPYTVTFEDLKMQPFFEPTNSTREFGDSFNCVGFFSAPIWSGLFVVFILLAITFYGIMMMMDIRTMDRFDDPKGKTITINAGE